MDFSGDPWNFYGFFGGLLGISMDFGRSVIFFSSRIFIPPVPSDCVTFPVTWPHELKSGTAAAQRLQAHVWVPARMALSSQPWSSNGMSATGIKDVSIFFCNIEEATSDKVQMPLWKKSYT